MSTVNHAEHLADCEPVWVGQSITNGYRLEPPVRWHRPPSGISRDSYTDLRFVTITIDLRVDGTKSARVTATSVEDDDYRSGINRDLLDLFAPLIAELSR